MADQAPAAVPVPDAAPATVPVPDAAPAAVPVPSAAQLPAPRGPLTERLFTELALEAHTVDWSGGGALVALGDDERQLALYCCYELHYGSFAGVDPGWEWEPSLLALRQVLEAAFESDLRRRVGEPPAIDVADVPAELWRLAGGGDGPSLSGWLARHGTLAHVRELAVHRSAYQLKEADPHTWALPRLRGDAKAAMARIQFDEYGNGVREAMHASMFADTMRALGLDPAPGAYLEALPGATLATTNLISWCGLHRRLRGALVGHLALFEMTSAGPMGRYADLLERLGVPAPARRFYDAHVVADREHQYVAVDGMVAGLLSDEPELAGDVVFGARALQVVEARFSAELLRCWAKGGSSLRGVAGATV